MDLRNTRFKAACFVTIGSTSDDIQWTVVDGCRIPGEAEEQRLFIHHDGGVEVMGLNPLALVMPNEEAIQRAARLNREHNGYLLSGALGLDGI